MKVQLKNARESKNLKLKDVAIAMGVDPALVSKWESGGRKPTKEQVMKLAEILELDTEKLLIEWMSEVILYEIGNDDLALKAMQLAEEKVKFSLQQNTHSVSKSLSKILKEIDAMREKLNQFRHLDSYRIAQAIELEYTFESNRIEGNTLTLKETDLVINEGITISGKSMREHLEAINHREAVEYLKHLVKKNTDLKERDILQLHNLILRGIDSENAGKYRNVQVMIKGSKHLPPQPFLVAKAMEDMMIWYRLNSKKLHPVILAAELSERLVTIHPFIDGNGRTSRLMMNLILLKHGYVIANIKGDDANRLNYYNCLETAQVTGKRDQFYEFIAEVEREALKRYLEILGKGK